MVPENCRYTKEHEWIRIEGALGVIGVTDYAQEQLGDVVFLELPEVGRTLAANEVFGTVESVKAVSELYSPVAGQVTEVNTGLVQKPEVVNTDPHGAAWMIKVKLADPAAVAGLMDAKAYQALVDSEAK